MTTAKITYEFPANFYELPDDPRLEVAANLFLFAAFVKSAAEHLGQYCRIHIKLEDACGYCFVQLETYAFVFSDKERTICRMADTFNILFSKHVIEPTYLDREIQLAAIAQAKAFQREALPHFNLDQEIEDLA